MSKHTPGPWNVDGPPWNQIVWSSAENRVCFLAHTNGLDDERDIATGRLIAAAPDLLEAAKSAAEELYHSAHSSGDPDDPENMQSDAVAYRELRAAIAKAEDRS